MNLFILVVPFKFTGWGRGKDRGRVGEWGKGECQGLPIYFSFLLSHIPSSFFSFSLPLSRLLFSNFLEPYFPICRIFFSLSSILTKSNYYSGSHCSFAIKLEKTDETKLKGSKFAPHNLAKKETFWYDIHKTTLAPHYLGRDA